MRITASLSPLEVTIINVMRKRNYGQLTVFFQEGIPVRYESSDSNLIFDGEDGREVLGKLSKTQ